jgi:arabinose-5-phosphate isomerase
MNTNKQFLQEAVKHFTQSLSQLPNLLNENFEEALQLIENTKGHLICCGMGKSGLVAQKMAATFASTGTPSFFLHPAEALHGDLGMITAEDSLILISNSGETQELCSILPSLKSFGNKSIAFTSTIDSTLGKYANITLPITFDRELCPNNLAPTTSTLLTLATGDLLAVALMNRKQFSSQDFAKFHPGGSLGKKLLMRVKDCMHKEPLPIVSADTLLHTGILTMTEARLGILLIYDDEKLLGIITDGDIRRALTKDTQALNQPCQKYVNTTPVTIHQDTQLAIAEGQLVSQQVNAILAVDDDDKVTGIYELHLQ